MPNPEFYRFFPPLRPSRAKALAACARAAAKGAARLSGNRNAWGKSQGGSRLCRYAPIPFLYTVLMRSRRYWIRHANGRARLPDNTDKWGTSIMAFLARKPYLVAIAVMAAAALLSIAGGIAA